MSHTNIEIKALCSRHDEIRNILLALHADFKGTDHQIDTYFHVPHGRLKLREGNIENNLIHYQREDTEGPKQADITLFRSSPGSPLKDILTKALGILVTMNKQREIYFMDNVKFHIDQVEGLGSFVEIEAIDADGTIWKEKLYEQCRYYLDLFGIQPDELVSGSYSDLLLSAQDSDA
jgi:predicted adenylyl cyclase CyaB